MLHQNGTNASVPLYIDLYSKVQEDLKPVIESISTHFDEKFVPVLKGVIMEMFVCGLISGIILGVGILIILAYNHNNHRPLF